MASTVARVPDLVGLGHSHGDGEVVGESVLIDRLAHSAKWDWLLIDTSIDHGRRFEDLHRGWIGLDRGLADGHVLIDQQPRFGGAPGTFMPRMSSGPNPALGRQRLASGATPLLVLRRYA
jgi:hypothetical protein